MQTGARFCFGSIRKYVPVQPTLQNSPIELGRAHDVVKLLGGQSTIA